MEIISSILALTMPVLATPNGAPLAPFFLDEYPKYVKDTNLSTWGPNIPVNSSVEIKRNETGATITGSWSTSVSYLKKAVTGNPETTPPWTENFTPRGGVVGYITLSYTGSIEPGWGVSGQYSITGSFGQEWWRYYSSANSFELLPYREAYQNTGEQTGTSSFQFATNSGGSGGGSGDGKIK